MMKYSVKFYSFSSLQSIVNRRMNERKGTNGEGKKLDSRRKLDVAAAAVAATAAAANFFR